MERSPSREEYEIVGLPEGFLGFSVAGGKRGKKNIKTVAVMFVISI